MTAVLGTLYEHTAAASPTWRIWLLVLPPERPSGFAIPLSAKKQGRKNGLSRLEKSLNPLF
ncbi:MAG: hypothetical protein F4114_10240 [Rhodospirillaceae bacterium]|nr:hypothetical protein [Rhodospirillaceae bacterium]MYB12711.1 hypothetical protein [Rhodospirillaceae bacterium]MYI49450.1 hypothetical protein [Rhodospirillaceae bacterium]